MQLLVARQRCGRCGCAEPIGSASLTDRHGAARLLHSPARLRTAGVLYLVLGGALAGAAAYLLVLITGIVRRSGDPDATTRFTGTTAPLALAYGALGFVLAVGLTGLAMGSWQVVHGRRNPRLVRIAIVLYVVFWCVALLAYAFA